MFGERYSGHNNNRQAVETSLRGLRQRGGRTLVPVFGVCWPLKSKRNQQFHQEIQSAENKAVKNPPKKPPKKKRLDARLADSVCELKQSPFGDFIYWLPWRLISNIQHNSAEQ